jgi:hypothetical protein
MPTETKGGGSCSHFGPRRQKPFCPDSKVEPGLKEHTKGSFSTSVSHHRLLQLGIIEFIYKYLPLMIQYQNSG